MRLALILLAALPMMAADPANGRFSGRVFDIQGTNKLADAIVTVSTPSGYVKSTVTGKSGDFNFASLPEGEYDFRVTAKGYAIYERQVTVSPYAGVRQLDIRMLVPADKQTVSVDELRKVNITRNNVPANASVQRGY